MPKDLKHNLHQLVQINYDDNGYDDDDDYDDDFDEDDEDYDPLTSSQRTLNIVVTRGS